MYRSLHSVFVKKRVFVHTTFAVNFNKLWALCVIELRSYVSTGEVYLLERLHDFNVYVSSDSYDPDASTDKQLCRHFAGAAGVIETIYCHESLVGRYVRM